MKGSGQFLSLDLHVMMEISKVPDSRRAMYSFQGGIVPLIYCTSR